MLSTPLSSVSAFKYNPRRSSALTSSSASVSGRGYHYSILGGSHQAAYSLYASHFHVMDDSSHGFQLDPTSDPRWNRASHCSTPYDECQSKAGHKVCYVIESESHSSNHTRWHNGTWGSNSTSRWNSSSEWSTWSSRWNSTGGNATRGFFNSTNYYPKCYDTNEFVCISASSSTHVSLDRTPSPPFPSSLLCVEQHDVLTSS
jgi:hypothetical protein